MHAILFQGQVIGHTAFELGDPGMGLAFGRMIPTEALADLRANRPPDDRIAETGRSTGGA